MGSFWTVAMLSELPLGACGLCHWKKERITPVLSSMIPPEPALLARFWKPTTASPLVTKRWCAPLMLGEPAAATNLVLPATSNFCVGLGVPTPTLPPAASVMVESPSMPAPSNHFDRRLAVPVLAVLMFGCTPSLMFAPPFTFAPRADGVAEFRTVPSPKTMPPRALIVPATSSVVCGLSVPMPTRPSGVTRICSLSRPVSVSPVRSVSADARHARRARRSEEHTSELQSRQYLVCRLLLVKKTR